MIDEKESNLRTDNRLPRVLHVLLHLEQSEDPITSEQLGKFLHMNSSLIRRTMAGLRRAGFVGSTKGHGGGWFLAKPLAEISLTQVFKALGPPNLFTIGQSNDAPSCLLEKAANSATSKALEVAQGAFDAELAKTAVSDLTSKHQKQIEQNLKSK